MSPVCLSKGDIILSAEGRRICAPSPLEGPLPIFNGKALRWRSDATAPEEGGSSRHWEAHTRTGPYKQECRRGNAGLHRKHHELHDRLIGNKTQS